jgi:hypothetical protein
MMQQQQQLIVSAAYSFAPVSFDFARPSTNRWKNVAVHLRTVTKKKSETRVMS